MKSEGRCNLDARCCRRKNGIAGTAGPLVKDATPSKGKPQARACSCASLEYTITPQRRPENAGAHSHMGAWAFSTLLPPRGRPRRRRRLLLRRRPLRRPALLRLLLHVLHEVFDGGHEGVGVHLRRRLAAACPRRLLRLLGLLLLRLQDGRLQRQRLLAAGADAGEDAVVVPGELGGGRGQGPGGNLSEQSSAASAAAKNAVSGAGVSAPRCHQRGRGG